MAVSSGLKWTPEQLAEYQARQARLRGTAGAPTSSPPPAPAPKRRKYGNKITVVDGLRFDSKHEAACWRKLVERERTGEIRGLRRQVRFALTVNGEAVCTYVADYVFEEDGMRVVADAKSEITRKDPAYVIKKKLMAAIHSITIREL